MISKQIFSYFPNGKITKFDFAKLFKVDLEARKKAMEMSPIPQVKIV